MANYANLSGRRRRNTSTLTSQRKAIAGRETEMAVNPAGGVSFKLDDFARLQRFLILGVEGNTYYQSQKTLVRQNVDCLERCLAADGIRVVDMVVEISTEGRAFKQDAGLFVLSAAASFKGGEVSSARKSPPNPNRFQYQENYEKALAEWEASKQIVPDEYALKVRQYALSKLRQVARTGTSLYMFAEFVRAQRGFGRSLRRAFADWLVKKPVDKLAYQAWKYKSRNGWTYRDIMRLAHPVTDERDRAAVFHYMAKGELPENAPESEAVQQIAAAESLLKIMNGRKNVTKGVIKEATGLITDYRLTHEAVPSELRKSPEIWEALLEDMPLQAAVSNLGVMTSVGLVKPLSAASRKIVDMLGNAEAIERSRMHPFRFYVAAKVYGQGRGIRGSLSWSPDQNIMDMLDSAYYAAFGNVESTGKNFVIAVDDSGSMGQGFWGGYGRTGTNVGTIPNTFPAEVAAAMALVTYRTEPNSVLIGYSGSTREMKVSRTRGRIEDIVKHVGRGGMTDTTLPVQYAMKNKLDVDGIVSYTDNCTWAGRGHATEYVRNYVKQYGPMYHINCAMVANSASDTDPSNPYMFELVGVDASTPRLISEFISGRL